MIIQNPGKKQSWRYDPPLNLPFSSTPEDRVKPTGYAGLESSAEQLLRQLADTRRAAGEAKINQERRQQRDDGGEGKRVE